MEMPKLSIYNGAFGYNLEEVSITPDTDRIPAQKGFPSI
jgi:hypothetical protein